MAGSVFETLSILVVDDSAHMRHLLHTLLHSLGVPQVHLAANGEEGWALYKKHEPDLILTDAAMMPVDGFEFAKKLRSQTSDMEATVPIIMISGHTELTAVERARDIGITEFLSKPISARALYERLILVLDRPRAFIETPTYRGPDRRRRSRPFAGEDRRGAVALI